MGWVTRAQRGEWCEGERNWCYRSEESVCRRSSGGGGGGGSRNEAHHHHPVEQEKGKH